MSRKLNLSSLEEICSEILAETDVITKSMMRKEY